MRAGIFPCACLSIYLSIYQSSIQVFYLCPLLTFLWVVLFYFLISRSFFLYINSLHWSGPSVVTTETVGLGRQQFVEGYWALHRISAECWKTGLRPGFLERHTEQHRRTGPRRNFTTTAVGSGATSVLLTPAKSVTFEKACASRGFSSGP